MSIHRKTSFVDLQICNNFNCNYVRPGRKINLQPNAGNILPNASIDTMGSALARKRINSNIIINAITSRKNTVIQISRPINCFTATKCGVAPICNLSTGNKNPNFINRY